MNQGKENQIQGETQEDADQDKEEKPEETLTGIDLAHWQFESCLKKYIKTVFLFNNEQARLEALTDIPERI